jgi:hypothetical protein
MPFALAVTMVTAVGLSLLVLGSLGALLAIWQLVAWQVAGTAPTVAEVWHHSGRAGHYLVLIFARLPMVLLGAIALQAGVAALGWGLLRRRPGARRAAIGATALGLAAAVVLRLLVHGAMLELAHDDARRAAFALAVDALATQVLLVMVAVAAALVLLMIQPAVRAQFSAGR